MKIGPFENKVGLNPTAAEPRSGAASARSGGAASAEPSAKVQLSESVSSSGDGSFDAAKVERISNAIREGRFKVNHEAIADKLIQNAQELLGATAKR